MNHLKKKRIMKSQVKTILMFSLAYCHICYFTNVYKSNTNAVCGSFLADIQGALSLLIDADSSKLNWQIKILFVLSGINDKPTIKHVV